MAKNQECAVVESLEIKLLTGEARSSREELNQLLADDFCEFGASGRKWQKSDIIEELLDAPAYKIEFDSMESRTIGENVVLVTYRSWRSQSSEPNAAIRSSIWRRRSKQWQLVFHQGTKIQL